MAHRSFKEGDILNKVRKYNRSRVKWFALTTFFIRLNKNFSVLVNWSLFLINNNIKGHVEITHKKFREGETKNKVRKSK